MTKKGKQKWIGTSDPEVLKKTMVIFGQMSRGDKEDSDYVPALVRFIVKYKYGETDAGADLFVRIIQMFKFIVHYQGELSQLKLIKTAPPNEFSVAIYEAAATCPLDEDKDGFVFEDMISEIKKRKTLHAARPSMRS